MYAIGAVLILDLIVFCLFEGKIPTHCAIDQTYSHYVEYFDFESKNRRMCRLLRKIIKNASFRTAIFQAPAGRIGAGHT